MTYTHHIPGRLRVRSAVIKHNPARAAALRQWLAGLPGVKRVETSTVTGSALVHYDSRIADGANLIASMRAAKWIAAPAPSVSAPVRARQRGGSELPRIVGKTVLSCVAEVAIERSVLALIAAVL